MANGLLITMPNKQAHAALSILKQSRILAPDVTEVGAIKHVMKLHRQQPECCKDCTGEGGVGG